jgi:hypothetical protein
MVLAVPHELLSGDMLALSIRIDQLRPAYAVSLAESTSWTVTKQIDSLVIQLSFVLEVSKLRYFVLNKCT